MRPLLPQFPPRLAAFLRFLLLPLPCAHAETFAGKVVRVLDGDTVEVLVRRTPRRVRLAGINRCARKGAGLRVPCETQAPGTGRRPGGPGGLARAGQVRPHRGQADRERSGPEPGDGQRRLAWWYREYASEKTPADRVLDEAAERKARTARRGLWADPAPMAPWVWRHRPPPAEGYAATCPCGSGKLCTGAKGGRFCIAEGRKKRYAKAR
jgi:micrococcal nuclease